MKQISKKNIINIIECIVVCLGAGLLLDKGTRNILPPVIALGWAVVKFRNDSSVLSKTEKLAISILAIFFSTAVELVEVEIIRANYNGIERLFNTIILFAALLFLFRAGISYVWRYARDFKVFENGFVIKNKKKAFWIVTASIFFLLLIGLLFDWPGDISKDSVAIINQALYESKMNAGFTFMIVWVMRACCNLALFLGADVSFGMGIYNLLQIIVIALIEGYIVYNLALKGLNKYYIIASVLFLGIMPYNVHFSHTVWKDIPFSLCCVAMMYLIWQEAMDGKSDYNKKTYWIKCIALVVSIIGMCNYRTNGFYAFLLALPFMIVVFWKNRKDVCITIVVAFVLAVFIQRPITDVVVNNHNKKYIEIHTVENKEGDIADSEINPSEVKTDNSNMMGQYGSSGIQIVTVQQIAAVAMNRCDLSSEDMEMISEVIDVEKLRDIYNPGISDNTLKTLVGCSTKRYLQIWTKLGLKYPSTYIAAWKNMTYGYWYPDMQERWVYADEMADNDYGIEKVEVLPHVIYQAKASIDRLYKRIPFYGLLWSIGFIVWVTAFAIALTVVKRGWKRALCYMPIVGVWISLLIATPVYGEFRYLYPFFMALPITLVIPYVEDVKQ